MPSRSRWGAFLYWSFAVVLTVFGFVDLIAIGAPFLLAGLAMLVVGRWRHRARVLWPALAGVWSFVLGYVLVAPLGCTSSAVPALPGSTGPPAVGHTTCANVLGIDYSGAGNYNPSLLPGFIAGLVAGAMGAVLARQVIAGRRPTAGAN
ncbi:MAG: hypothetical protein HYU54_06540 [Actinobacteria bacterium]|nr:hypothetical protein [Actinomycetota bacterium]